VPINFGEGNDSFTGAFNNDTLNFAGGDDFLNLQNSTGTTVNGGSGNDTLTGFNVNFSTIVGNDGNDFFRFDQSSRNSL
jgi:Ca2+-binding RTX toxin-like protein